MDTWKSPSSTSSTRHRNSYDYDCNLRAWRHFIEQRSNRFAEAEIRRLASKIYTAIAPHAPIVFEDYKYEMVDGYHEYKTENTKV